MSAAADVFDRIVAQQGRRVLNAAEDASLLADIAQNVCDLLKVELCSVIKLLPNGQGQVLVDAGWPASLAGETTVELGAESPAGLVIRSQLPIAIGDLRADQRFDLSPGLRDQGVVSCLVAPLYGRDRPLGVLGAYSRKTRSFSEHDRARVQILAHLVSGAIARQEQEQNQQSQKLARAEQMMAIGQVAAGVAHELRNPLTSIKGLVQVNLRDLTERGLPTEDLAIIEHEIRRMERTLQTFLDFARPPVPQRLAADLAPIAERVLALVGGRARKQGVALDLIRPPGDVTGTVDSDQIQQLLLNLVLNALDALPGGGRIEIELQAPLDGFIHCYVRDNGPGIAPHILPKVFDTFVSNKETGVGLGLPLSRRIAEEHGGSLAAYNLPESGACFLLRLPVE